MKQTQINSSSSISCLSIFLSTFWEKTGVFGNVLLHVLTSPPLSSLNTSREVSEIPLFYFSLNEAS